MLLVSNDILYKLGNEYDPQETARTSEPKI